MPGQKKKKQNGRITVLGQREVDVLSIETGRPESAARLWWRLRMKGAAGGPSVPESGSLPPLRARQEKNAFFAVSITRIVYLRACAGLIGLTSERRTALSEIGGRNRVVLRVENLESCIDALKKAGNSFSQ